MKLTIAIEDGIDKMAAALDQGQVDVACTATRLVVLQHLRAAGVE
jgi:hypothetical protein